MSNGYREVMEHTAAVYAQSMVEQLLAEASGRCDGHMLIDVNKKLLQALRLQAHYLSNQERTHQNINNEVRNDDEI